MFGMETDWVSPLQIQFLKYQASPLKKEDERKKFKKYQASPSNLLSP
jgi:hypothetical protein